MILAAHLMRNDVSIPPEDSDALDSDALHGSLIDHPRRDVSSKPIPPPDGLIADVELFDHPNFAPTGAGNFWLLGMIGIALIGVILVLFWMLKGLMK